MLRKILFIAALFIATLLLMALQKMIAEEPGLKLLKRDRPVKPLYFA